MLHLYRNAVNAQDVRTYYDFHHNHRRSWRNPSPAECCSYHISARYTPNRVDNRPYRFLSAIVSVVAKRTTDALELNGTYELTIIKRQQIPVLCRTKPSRKRTCAPCVKHLVFMETEVNQVVSYNPGNRIEVFARRNSTSTPLISTPICRLCRRSTRHSTIHAEYRSLNVLSHLIASL